VAVQSPSDAALIQSLLVGSGIPCFIPDPNFGLIYGGALGIKIQVRAEDYLQAKAFLETKTELSSPHNNT
jgi:hypothetical protein